MDSAGLSQSSDQFIARALWAARDRITVFALDQFVAGTLPIFPTIPSSGVVKWLGRSRHAVVPAQWRVGVGLLTLRRQMVKLVGPPSCRELITSTTSAAVRTYLVNRF
jgi:hypothetical protein